MMRYVLALIFALLSPVHCFASTIGLFLNEAHGKIGTIYAVGEMSCGTRNRLRKCTKGVRTASGEPLDPDEPQVALSLPYNVILHAQEIYLRLKDGACTKIHLVDKKSPRMKHKPWDLTPGAVRALGANPTPWWSARIYICGGMELS
jgi:hypothetical protein